MALGFLVILIGLSLLSVSLFLFLRQKLFLGRARLTSGEVIGINQRASRHGPLRYPVVRFQTPFGQAVEFEATVGTSFQAYRVGQRIQVVYDPENPQKASIRSFAQQWLGCLIVGLIGTAFLCAGPVILLVNSLVASLSQRQQTADARQQGLQALEDKDYTRAVDLFTRVIDEDPNNADAYVNRGVTYFCRKDYDQAIHDFNAAIRMKPDHKGAYVGRGQAHHYQKNYKQAIADFTEAILINPKDGSALTNRSWAYAREKDYHRAFADCRAAITLAPEDPAGYNMIAWLWATCPEANLRNGPEAVQYAIKACEMASWKEPAFMNTLAAAYAEVGRFDEAVKYQKRAAEARGPYPLEEVEQGLLRLKLYGKGSPYRDQ
jgi:tetratricopeptide (TPR) repeat protein